MADPGKRVVLLHNPRCSKSRAALLLLQERGVTVDVRRYLDEPLTRPELVELAQQLGRPVSEWVRRGEEEYRAAGLGPDSSEAELLAALAKHPILLERPIAVLGRRAVVGRPPGAVLELFADSGHF